VSGKVADYQSAIRPIANRRYAVAQIGNLLYRRLATGLSEIITATVTGLPQ
jgi:hypothetical protein